MEEKKVKKKKTEDKKPEEPKQEDKGAKEEKDDSEVSSFLKKKQNKQIIWAIIFMLFVFFIFFIVPYFVKNYMNSFFYAGLNFQKTKQGQVFYYSTYVPITNQKLQVTGSYPVNFKNDPRKIEYIKVDVNSSELSFFRENIVYMTIASNSPKCEYNIVAGARLAAFLNGFAGMNVAGALDNKTAAEESKLPYVTCKTNPMNTVILLKSGDKTEIRKLDKNCYELRYKACEILDVTERFQMEILKNYMSYLKGI